MDRAEEGSERVRLIAMIDHDGKEPPASLPDREAEATWAAVSCLWHPALLARTESLPTIEGIDFPPVPEPRDARLVAEGVGSRLPADYRSIAGDAGAVVIEGGIDRVASASRVLLAIAPGAETGDPADPLVAAFFALGTARWWLRDLTTAMQHADCLDVEGLTREALAAARDWRHNDRTGAANRLRAAFEILTQARERFYPVDAYLLDLCLLDAGLPAGALAESLEARVPFTILAPASAIEKAATIDPDAVAALRQAITEGWADVAGGPYAETTEPLAPLSSILWQFRKAGEVYRAHLDDRNVEALANRRFALYPQRPQIAKRFGFRFAYHLGLDAGRFPIPPDAKRLWEAPDGSHLESLMRPPLAADRPSEGLRLPWRLGASMKEDHVAVVPMMHWPIPVAGWFRDFRVMVAHSPVLARSMTLNDFFQQSDRPWEMTVPKLDDYVTPYLAQAAARGATDPISRRVRHLRLRSRLDALTTTDALARALVTTAVEIPEDAPPQVPIGTSDARFSALETNLETGRLDEVEAAIGAEETAASEALSRAIAGDGDSGLAGFLVLNPSGVARRAVVTLAGAADDLAASGPLLAAQPTEEGVVGIVELAAFGFAWVPRESNPDRPIPSSGTVSTSGRTLRNDAMEVEFDPSTGGIRGIRAPGEPTARIGQQLTIAGLADAEGKPSAALMVGEEFALEYGGPALARASSTGRLVHPGDGRTLAKFRQVANLWKGRPTLEIAIALDDLDAGWLESLASADPWTSYLACRWAWPDFSSTLRRSGLLAMETTAADRPETPDCFEIGMRGRKTALLFGGLAHHRRHGPRMLDTLLIAGNERALTCLVGVALDLDFPFQAATDFVAPALVVATAAGPPRNGPSGWLVHVDSKAVAVTTIEFVSPTADGHGWGLAITLMETSGRSSRSKIRLFRDPIAARQTNFTGEVLIDLPVQGDAVPIDLTPFEMARVEIALGG